MSVKVGINGFGRIGRLVARAMIQRKGEFDLVGINDVGSSAKVHAHLFKHDSVHGRYHGTVEHDENSIVVDGDRIRVLSERNPAALPWGELGADIVIESTGVFTGRAAGGKAGYDDHIKAGAKKVILSAPAKDKIDATVVLGVNDNTLASHHTFVSNGSCTTNCLAPLVKVMVDNPDVFGKKIEGFMTTIHAYTNDQKILDQVHGEDLLRARAAAVNIIPSSTGAAKAIGLVVPSDNVKLDGFAFRVPVTDGSAVDLTVMLEKDVDVAAVNALFKKTAEGPMKGILEYNTAPLVSSDIVGNPHSSVFDSTRTMASGRMLKLVSWYDNEWGFSNRVGDLAVKLAKMI
ncbi:MAG: type I glyceraldehyde-3-phosphate dehydrogenase [Phycisphaerales bacterium]|nr:type I glyceraldehyde-3-phosphate dehydrogenase [Phycisphaerales bacterium]MCB9864649.1 type I glyceraldehyde-3-phosphate dehydrogenase [Phycisphaerales bacterium]